MQGRSHAEFRSLFEKIIDEMQEAGCVTDANNLCRKYLSKLTLNNKNNSLQKCAALVATLLFDLFKQSNNAIGCRNNV